MNLKHKLILEEYRKQKDSFILLENAVNDILQELIKKSNITVLGIQHRVKDEKSLAGKLEKNSGVYSSLSDLTDILGARIICHFNDDIDRMGKEVEKAFVIDHEKSSDKRALIKADTFGYLSLHYICSLPSGDKWPDEICGIKFEIQIRTILQHAWSDINHDIGYKSDFGVPREITRQFARLSGLLELVDDEFVRARDNMKKYSNDIRERIKTDDVDDIAISTLSLNEYVLNNRKMRALINDIANIGNAEISEIDPENYISQLAFLGITTLGGIETMINDNRALALKLAEKALSTAMLDIVSSSVALRFLCRAELLNKNYSFEKTTEFLKLSLGSEDKAQRQAKHLLKQKEEC